MSLPNLSMRPNPKNKNKVKKPISAHTKRFRTILVFNNGVITARIAQSPIKRNGGRSAFWSRGRGGWGISPERKKRNQLTIKRFEIGCKTAMLRANELISKLVPRSRRQTRAIKAPA